MPLTFTKKDRTIISITHGDVDYATGMTQLLAAIHEAARLRAADGGPPWHYLADIRESSEQRTGDELWAIASLLAGHRAVLSGRVAIVVTSRHHTEITRMFGTIVERNGMTLAAFTDPAAAHRWLAEA